MWIYGFRIGLEELGDEAFKGDVVDWVGVEEVEGYVDETLEGMRVRG